MYSRSILQLRAGLHAQDALQREQERAAEMASKIEAVDLEGETEKFGKLVKKGHHITAGLGDVAALKDLAALKDVTFAFQRCESRLYEMFTPEYHQVVQTHPTYDKASFIPFSSLLEKK
jgi:predicted ATPase